MAVANGSHAGPAEKPYEGFRVLVVDDNERTLDLIIRGLRLFGVDIVGPADNLSHGLDLAKHASLDFALLDLDMGNGQNSFDIAAELRRRRIPFVFMSSMMTPDLGPFEEHACYDKLVRPLDIRKVLDEHLTA